MMSEEAGVRIAGMSRMRIGMLAWLPVALLSAGAYAAPSGAPVAKLTMIEGTVAYSKQGDSWREIARNKYLFEGYQVRTGGDGSARVVNQASGDERELGPETTIRIGADELKLIAGNNLSEPEDSGGSFWQALTNKFSKAQRYTTVRRSVSGGAPVAVSTPESLTVSPRYDELVWSNVGPEYSYAVAIDDELYDVPPSATGEMVRFELPALAPGEHTYGVRVRLEGEIVYQPKRPSKLVYLSRAQQGEVVAELESLKNAPSTNDAFVIANHFESQGLLVPAMDAYRDYFQQHPEENDMRPYLIKAYRDLGLMQLKTKEAITYNSMAIREQL